LYEPLGRWSQDQVHVMKEMIDERLRQLLALHHGENAEVEEVMEQEEIAVVDTVQETEEQRLAREQAEQLAREKALARCWCSATQSECVSSSPSCFCEVDSLLRPFMATRISMSAIKHWTASSLAE